MKVNISDEVLTEIGKITIIFSLIESSLAGIIGTIVTMGGRPHELGTILTAEMSFRQRISALDSLLIFALGKEHEGVEEFNEVKKALNLAENERNIVAHSVWLRHDDPDPHAVVRMRSTAKMKTGLRTRWDTMSLEDLKGITTIVGKAYMALSLFELHLQEESDVVEPPKSPS